MKHLLNNLSSEEKNRILEQYKNSLLIETKKFDKLINGKSGDVKPLLNEDPHHKKPIQNPIQKTVVTQTTTLSPDQERDQRTIQNRTEAQKYLAEKFKIGSTLPLFDKENDSQPIGTYRILGQIVPPNTQPTEINPSSVTKNGKLIFTVKALSNVDVKKKQLTLTFTCEKGHKLLVGNSKPGMFRRMGDAFDMGQAVVYSKNLTSKLQSGYCQNRGGQSVTNTDL